MKGEKSVLERKQKEIKYAEDVQIVSSLSYVTCSLSLSDPFSDSFQLFSYSLQTTLSLIAYALHVPFLSFSFQITLRNYAHRLINNVLKMSDIQLLLD